MRPTAILEVAPHHQLRRVSTLAIRVILQQSEFKWITKFVVNQAATINRETFYTHCFSGTISKTMQTLQCIFRVQIVCHYSKYQINRNIAGDKHRALATLISAIVWIIISINDIHGTWARRWQVPCKVVCVPRYFTGAVLDVGLL